MREGRTFKRCSKCGATVKDRECRCGNRTYSWAFIVDVAAEGAPRKQVRRGGFARKQDALDAMHELQGAHAGGTAVAPSKMTVAQYLAFWLDSIKPPNATRGHKPLKPGTWEERRRRMELYVIPHIGNIPLQGLSELDLETMYRKLEQTKKQRGKEPKCLARSTVHGIHLVLHAALEDAVRRRPAALIARNVADGLYSAPSTPDEEVRTWNATELNAFLDHVGQDEFFAFWRLAAMTGARRGELLGLRWRDADLTAGTITINKGRVKGFDGAIESGRPKSARSRRTIEIDAGTISALADLRRHQDVVSIDGLIFTYADGKPVHPDGITQRFDRHVREAGLSKISLKGLRHTHATLMLLNGKPLHVVSRRLGHANEAFTARVYSHVLPGQDGAAAEDFAAMVDGGAR